MFSLISLGSRRTSTSTLRTGNFHCNCNGQCYSHCPCHCNCNQTHIGHTITWNDLLIIIVFEILFLPPGLLKLPLSALPELNKFKDKFQNPKSLSKFLPQLKSLAVSGMPALLSTRPKPLPLSLTLPAGETVSLGWSHQGMVGFRFNSTTRAYSTSTIGAYSTSTTRAYSTSTIGFTSCSTISQTKQVTYSQQNISFLKILIHSWSPLYFFYQSWLV